MPCKDTLLIDRHRSLKSTTRILPVKLQLDYSGRDFFTPLGMSPIQPLGSVTELYQKENLPVNQSLGKLESSVSTVLHSNKFQQGTNWTYLHFCRATTLKHSMHMYSKRSPHARISRTGLTASFDQYRSRGWLSSSIETHKLEKHTLLIRHGSVGRYILKREHLCRTFCPNWASN